MSAPVRPQMRHWSDVLHRWLGFTAGAILVVIGLSGSMLAFYMEIERGWYPHMRTQAPHARPASYESVYLKLATLPVKPAGGTWRIEIPPGGGVITSRYSAPGARTRMVTLDPITLDVKRDAFWNRTFFTFVYDIHEYLQFGAGARPWIGYVSWVMVIVLLTGVTSWLLPRGSVGAKLSFRWRDTTTARRTYDLHKIGGAAGVLVLALTVGTGALISMPTQFRAMLNAFSPLKPSEPPVKSHPLPGRTRIPVDEILKKGPDRFPGSTIVWVRVPTSPSQTYDLQIRQAGAPMNRFPRTHLFVDQFSGDVLATYDPKQDGWGDTALNWLVPLHDGKAFGTTGRVVVFVAGFIPLVLFITGFMRWNQKRRAARRGHRLQLGATVILCLLSASPLWAHHTVASTYDPEKRATLNGVVGDIEWKQPHVVVHVDVKDSDGRVVAWVVETQTPLVLRSHGLQQGMIKPGMNISTTICVARDGSRRGYAQNFVVPDGGMIISFGCNAGRSTP